MEDDVAELAQIAFLGRDLRDTVDLPGDPPPTAQLFGDQRGEGFGRAGDVRLGVFGQPAEVARDPHRHRTQPANVLNGPRGQTTHQRDEQQRVDGGEPETSEHVEQLQSVQPGTDRRMRGQVLLDLGLVEAALGQQSAGHRPECEQEQQRQRGAHRGQRAPALQEQRHIGSLTSLTKPSRIHEMNSFHAPVTRASPTTMSSTPPRT